MAVAARLREAARPREAGGGAAAGLGTAGLPLSGRGGHLGVWGIIWAGGVTGAGQGPGRAGSGPSTGGGAVIVRIPGAARRRSPRLPVGPITTFSFKSHYMVTDSSLFRSGICSWSWKLFRREG